MDQRKLARREKFLLERAAAAAERDRVVSERAMQAALQGRSAWNAEAIEMEASALQFDWRERMDNGTLSEKQMKLAESMRSKEYKLQVLPSPFTSLFPGHSSVKNASLRCVV